MATLTKNINLLTKSTTLATLTKATNLGLCRGEWFHSFGVHDAFLKVLSDAAGVQNEHLELARDSGVERPMMEFVKV